MEYNKIHELVNQVNKEVLGESEITEHDLKSVIDIGFKTLNDVKFKDIYTKTLLDRIARTDIIIKPYKKVCPSLVRQGHEWGGLVQKIRMKLPKSVEEKGWELEDGKDYTNNIFRRLSVEQSFYGRSSVYGFQIDLPKDQLNTAFLSASKLSEYINAIHESVNKKIEMSNDNLLLNTINNMVANTIASEYENTTSTELAKKTGIKARNLLFEYNKLNKTKLTKENCLQDTEFLRYVVEEIVKCKDRMSFLSKIFNIENYESSTNEERLILLCHLDLKIKLLTQLQATTYHKELLELPNFSSMPYWQGSGLDYGFANTSKINIKTENNKNVEKTVELDGILAVMFDEDALGVYNELIDVETDLIISGRFWKTYYHVKNSYFNDFHENFVVFFIQ